MRNRFYHYVPSNKKEKLVDKLNEVFNTRFSENNDEFIGESENIQETRKHRGN